MIHKKLAIVIPAYKITFLEKTLQSIAAQTSQEFILYIGDDCSPYDLYSVISKYEDKIELIYKRFDSNLGGENLVAQWERCIDLAKQEEWIWLFSDDDIMDENCVETFYRELEVNGNKPYVLYHFNVNQIDEKNQIIKKLNRYPTIISSKDFFIKRSTSKISSFVVEYIFHRDVYMENGGFQPFDLAWGTDHATWIKFSYKTQIKTIDEAEVYWRYSSENISPNREDLRMNIRKIKANCDYYLWVYNFFTNFGDTSIPKVFYLQRFLADSKAYNKKSTWNVIKNEIKRICKVLKIHSTQYIIYMLVHKIYKFIKDATR